jgi:cell division septation protein DedD
VYLMSRPFVAPALFAFLLVAPLAAAQTTPPVADSAAAPSARDAIPRPANDSLFRRARRLVSEGNGAAGRALVDSLLTATDPATPAYGDALYWHGALAPTAAAAEGDYRRVIVEYPLAYYSGDALLAIAELEQARGDRVGAMQHLQRFVREHPDNPGRGLAALGAARLAFEQRDSTLACSMLVEARRSAATSDVELRNQIAYYGNRCAAAPAASPTVATTTSVAATPAPAAAAPAAVTPTPSASQPTSATSKPAAAPKPATATPPKTASTARAKTAPTAAPAKAPAKAAVPRTDPASHTVTRYTVQVAAYDTRADAAALVKKLAERGIKARVSGTSKPFRVRLGLHATRKQATDEATALRKRGIDGFVAEEEQPAGARTP